MENDRVLLALRLRWRAGRSGELNGLDFAKLFKDAEQCVHRDHCAVCRIAQVSQDASPRLEEHHIAGKVRGQPTSLTL